MSGYPKQTSQNISAAVRLRRRILRGISHFCYLANAGIAFIQSKP
jgi:hypothetical protein